MRRSVLEVAAVFLLVPCDALGFGTYCPEVDDRVIRADTIVLGHTTKVDREQIRPRQIALTYYFEVDEVLKGGRYKPGDKIVERIEQQIFGYDPFPFQPEERAVVFANSGEGTEVHFDCSASLSEIDLPRLRRVIEVSTSPEEFLTSDRPLDIEVLFRIIERRCTAYPDSGIRRIPQADWETCRPLSEKQIVGFLQKHHDSSDAVTAVRSLRLLTHLRPPGSFDTFIETLNGKEPSMICLGARGLQWLGDRRAIAPLIDRITRYRDQEKAKHEKDWLGPKEFSILSYDGEGRMARRWHPESELIAAIASFDDPRVRQFFLGEFDGPNADVAVRTLGEAADPRAIDPLLRRLWAGDHGAVVALAHYDDERILQQARERMYDHPLAPDVLAQLGDPEAKEFMLRLMRQGHSTGARWVASTQDRSAKADLIRTIAHHRGDHGFINMATFALGRLRPFDLIPSLIADANNLDGMAVAGGVMLGLGDMWYDRPAPCPRDQILECRRAAMIAAANREGWRADQLDAAMRLVKLLEPPFDFPEYHDSRRPWTPPAGLPDMPDNQDKEATASYLKNHAGRCEKTLWDAKPLDRYNLLVAFNVAQVSIDDPDLLVRLLTDPDPMMLRGAIGVATSAGPVSASVVQRWFEGATYSSASQCLRYISRNPRPEYIPTVVNATYRGEHFFDEQLYSAIIETKATQCADLLRAYLEDQHVVLRVNAAATLILLGDESGKPLLQRIDGNLFNGRGGLGSDYRTRAMKLAAE